MSDIIVSRAGANAICEIQALKKPSILIPLSANASRGDQILNAKSFEKQGFSEVIEEEYLTVNLLCDTIDKVYKNSEKYITAINNSPCQNSIDIIIDLIQKASQKK